MRSNLSELSDFPNRVLSERRSASTNTYSSTIHLTIYTIAAGNAPKSIMIRSRSIPLVLSRVAGDGIHAVLLVDKDGELLGSYGNPPPRHPSQDDNNIGMTQWPLDAASIGALISEVAGDYQRMGEDLLLLDPLYYSQRSGHAGQMEGGLQHQQQQQQQHRDGLPRGEEDVGSSSLQQSEAMGKSGKEKSDSGTNLKSLVIELDYVSLNQCFLPSMM